MAPGQLKTCIVGCNRGLFVARRLLDLEEYRFAAVCDLNKERAERAAAELGGLAVYTDYEAMLAAEKPDVVFLATNTQPRANLAIGAAEAGVPGIIAEKPMAMSMGEAKAMVAAARRSGSKMIVTHQRRMGADLVEMKALISQGAIGDVHLVRAGCAGDLLTDGTHAIDSVRWLAGDQPALWVLGQAFRVLPGPDGPVSPEFEKHTGFRYGHPVESGAMGIVQFESGLRGEIFTGRAQQKGRGYQDYEVFGSTGRLWRPGDKGALRIQDAQAGGWRELPIRAEDALPNAMRDAWVAFARQLREGGDHPLSAEQALKTHEIVMAIYESARRNQRIDLPLDQDAFPLQLMIDEGRA